MTRIEHSAGDPGWRRRQAPPAPAPVGRALHLAIRIDAPARSEFVAVDMTAPLDEIATVVPKGP